MNKSKIIPTIKKWLLMISMSLGIGGYFLILALDLGHETNHQIATVVTNMLPYLLFVMLFLEFSKIEPRDLFPKLQACHFGCSSRRFSQRYSLSSSSL